MSITLSGHQLKSLLEFANPDGDNDLDQLETELTISFLEDGHSGKGYYVWMTEYPEEGCMFLDDLDQKSLNKYDWSNVPSEVNWIATDSLGYGLGWVNKPHHHSSGQSRWNDEDCFFRFGLPPQVNPFKGDWKESLEQRPEELSQ
ncbi:hypothetical protein F904_02719 [Acinetobacter dispersus]|uniref:Uncharacterized protein n=1 Tax=Acinetobacter dispersus TaxID=70348 RepID=N9MPT4_9GAMM|nr:hypothetical protein [Acinetobacter dispersus]ENW92776.1 hypothetical protein F904_02719 [Acinetobacter dispersus]